MMSEKKEWQAKSALVDNPFSLPSTHVRNASHVTDRSWQSSSLSSLTIEKYSCVKKNIWYCWTFIFSYKAELILFMNRFVWQKTSAITVICQQFEDPFSFIPQITCTKADLVRFHKKSSAWEWPKKCISLYSFIYL